MNHPAKTGTAATKTPASIPPPIKLPIAANPEVIPAAEVPATVPPADIAAIEVPIPAPAPATAPIPPARSDFVSDSFAIVNISLTTLCKV